MTKSVQFYFEFASPYSYLASLDIDDAVALKGRHVEWIPIEIGKVWAAQNVLDAYLAVRALKSAYIWTDARRCAARKGIDLRLPSSPATDTRLAKYVYWDLVEASDTRAKAFLSAVWSRYFVEGLSIVEKADILTVADGMDLDLAKAEAAFVSPFAKAQQAASNAAAVASGCFGVPWFLADGEAYFGHDRIGQMTESIAPQSVD